MADVMFVNQIPFIITYGHGVGLIMVECIPNRTMKQLAINLTIVLQLYALAGFIVQTLLMDMECEQLRDILPQVNVNISASNEHVAEVKLRIGTVKEQCREILAMLPFTHLPQQIVIRLVQFTMMWWNSFQQKMGFSARQSPRELI